MATYLAPGVYVDEVPSAVKPIAGVGTSTAGFIAIIADSIKIPKPEEKSATPVKDEPVKRAEGEPAKAEPPTGADNEPPGRRTRGQASGGGNNP